MFIHLYSGPLIDGLGLDCLVHKFVDGTTASEILKRNQISNMVNIMRQLVVWSESNNMNINLKKTKEIILGTLIKNPPPILTMSGVSIESVSSFKTAGCDHLIDFEVGRTGCNDLLKNCLQDALTKDHQACGISQADALCFYMHGSHPFRTWICLSSMAQHAHEETLILNRVTTDSCHAHHLRWREIRRSSCHRCKKPV